jgi:hypothetical protein
MRRVNFFLVTLIVSLVAMVAVTAIGFAIFTTAQNPYNWMSQMWGGTNPYTGTNGMGGGMMGQTSTQTPANPLMSYFGVIFAVLIGVTFVGIIGLGYYITYPQIRTGNTSASQRISMQIQSNATPYESVSKTLTKDELKIVTVLNAHNGKYLQKYIKNETGLSRLQTHRIIARLADRGIVSLEKTGNTNQVILANWLQKR